LWLCAYCQSLPISANHPDNTFKIRLDILSLSTYHIFYENFQKQ
jgi:hypothetical protein